MASCALKHFRDHFSLSGRVKVGKFTSREVKIWQIHVVVEQGRKKRKKQNKTNEQKQE